MICVLRFELCNLSFASRDKCERYKIFERRSDAHLQLAICRWIPNTSVAVASVAHADYPCGQMQRSIVSVVSVVVF